MGFGRRKKNCGGRTGHPGGLIHCIKSALRGAMMPPALITMMAYYACNSCALSKPQDG